MYIYTNTYIHTYLSTSILACNVLRFGCDSACSRTHKHVEAGVVSLISRREYLLVSSPAIVRNASEGTARAGGVHIPSSKTIVHIRSFLFVELDGGGSLKNSWWMY